MANYPLPSILLNQDEKLASARKSAADGYLSSYTIPLLAEPETLVQTSLSPSTAKPSLYPAFLSHSFLQPWATHPRKPFPLTSSFLQLPDPVSRFGTVRLVIVAGPAFFSPLLTLISYPALLTSFTLLSHPLPPTAARLPNVAGLTNLPFLLSPLHTLPPSFHTPSIPCRPGLSLWQVPPYPPFFFSSFPLYSLPRTHFVSLRRLVIVAGLPPFLDYLALPLPPTSPCCPTSSHQGPACHCGWSRLTLLPSLPPSHFLPFPSRSPGPACHCGRSRRVPSLILLFPRFSTVVSLHLGPACHCGRSRRLLL